MLHGNFEGQAAPHNPGLFEWLFGQRKHAPDKQANDRDNLSVVERFRVRHLASGDTREFALKDLHKHVRQFGFMAAWNSGSNTCT